MAAAGPSRKRSRTFETSYDGAADDEAHSKGGHSLRKRARIDYTQEMIDDDLGLPAPKNDLFAKPAAVTPSARGRRRKGVHDDSGEESDGFASNPKRHHRADKSPAPARPASSRRRHPSKKLSPDASAYVDQPSDNEVQDTILVSVPNMGPGAPAEESDRSSAREAESPQTSSDESDEARARGLPPTPRVQPSASIKHEVSVAAEDEVIDKSLIPEPADEKPPIAPEPISLTPGPEIELAEHAERAPEKDAASLPTDLIVSPTAVAEADSTNEDVALPGPFTEWVYPAEPAKDDSTPTSTPAAAPAPAEKKPAEMEWDARRRLKASEFFALYKKEKKRRQERGEPPISMIEFNNECARRYKSAHAQDGDSQTPSSTTESAETSTVVAVRPENPEITVEEELPQNSQVAESGQFTAAPSPAPADDAADQEDAVDDEQEAEDAVDEQIPRNGPVEPVEVTRNPSKQYLFPKIRDPNDFVEAFEGWQDFSNEHLYETVAAAIEAMHAYQQEYNELKKYLDDEENAKRRQANDKTIVNWENRQKADEPLPWRRHFDDVKEEDRIMAQAHGFKLNTHPTQIGRQNPEEQRWEMPENRLRRRTEKGAELAEENVIEGKRVRKPRYVSDQSKDPSRSGTPAVGVLFGPARRQRRRPGTATANGDEPEGQEQAQLAESFGELPRKGRAARSRGTVLPDDQDQIPAVAEADNNQTEDEDEANGKTKVLRRRGRAAAAVAEPPTSVPAGFGGEVSKPKRVRGGKGPQAGGEIVSSSFYSNASTTATQPGSRPSTASSEATARTAETVESAYSLRDKRKRNFALENDPELEPRPQRRRGPPAQKPEPVEPKKRGPRKKETAQQPPPPAAASTSVPAASTPPPLQQPIGTKFFNFMPSPAGHDAGNGSQPVPAQASGPFLHTFNASPAFPPGAPPPPPPPPSVKKPITKIKLTNNGASSSQAASRPLTPANGPSGANNTKPGGKGARGNKGHSTSEAKADAAAHGNGDFEKPYAEMTKSEKMSWSMRRRWASGEMQGAVEKRRNTLANKKAEKAASSTNSTTPAPADQNTTTQATDASSAGRSGTATPASMHGLGPGPLALPQGPPPPPPPVLLQPAQPHQGYLQQPPPYPYPFGPTGPSGRMS
ncbi:5ca77c6a-6cc6-499f-958a-04fdca8e8adc [Thermothielavioides terrestris]|uniref:5ca77c6a-6cc6-499f-958a-04fdca8e8adc n=1 Tax=Thermothielavioides terrestris TaxID=2587410 RepID=A0A446B560_9PEZI|nr:5ca77c6a-6cc6-499f-958a-04fdca8e8adc [Thermothielavioides terrestris]